VEQYELGYSEASVEQYLALLSSYFTDLVESDILPKNPAYRVRAPKDEGDVEDDIVVFTKEEQDAILQASYEMKNGFLFELALRSGLRRGELLALEYSDFTDNGVWVRKTLVNVPVTGEDGSKKWVHKVTITKSQSGHRFVPLPQDVLAHLTEHRRAQVKQLGGSFSKIVFTTKTGKHLSLSSIGYKQSNLLRNLDLPHKKFHSYRHTYITNCIELGLDIATVQELAGHSSLDMTRRYVHLSTEHKVRAVQKMYEAMS
jgi:integrase